MAALAFLPSQERIEQGWNIITQTSSPTIAPFLHYFEEQWLGLVKRGKREGALPTAMWTFYRQLQEGIPITTNSVEGWHTKLDNLLKKRSNSLTNLMEAIRMDQTSNDRVIDQYLNGIAINKPGSSKLTFTERMTSIISTLEDDASVDGYLDRVASLMLNTGSE